MICLACLLTVSRNYLVPWHWFIDNCAAWCECYTLAVLEPFNAQSEYAKPLTIYFASQGVQDMSFLLAYPTDFNEDISAWNTSAVTNMRGTDGLKEVFPSQVHFISFAQFYGFGCRVFFDGRL